jgi:hypothetical protein
MMDEGEDRSGPSEERPFLIGGKNLPSMESAQLRSEIDDESDVTRIQDNEPSTNRFLASTFNQDPNSVRRLSMSLGVR